MGDTMQLHQEATSVEDKKLGFMQPKQRDENLRQHSCNRLVAIAFWRILMDFSFHVPKHSKVPAGFIDLVYAGRTIQRKLRRKHIFS